MESTVEQIDWLRIAFSTCIATQAISRGLLHLKAKNWSESGKAIAEGEYKQPFKGFGSYAMWMTLTCVAWAINPLWFFRGCCTARCSTLVRRSNYLDLCLGINMGISGFGKEF